MDPFELTQQVFRVLETGDVELATTIFASDYVNHAAAVSPAACRLPGPAAALATATWLRSAYPDLRYTVHDVVEHGDEVWSRVRMTGRHTGPFVRFRDGQLDQVIPPTGRSIDVAHFHVLTRRQGQVVAHEAIHDDLTMVRQLDVIPPNPRAIARIAAWRLTGHAARAAEDVSNLAEQAARRTSVAHPA